MILKNARFQRLPPMMPGDDRTLVSRGEAVRVGVSSTAGATAVGSVGDTVVSDEEAIPSGAPSQVLDTIVD